jgi:hypothetical protein
MDNEGVADDTGFVDLLTGKADIFRGGRRLNQTFCLGTFAYSGDLTALPRRIVFISKAALGLRVRKVAAPFERFDACDCLHADAP